MDGAGAEGQKERAAGGLECQDEKEDTSLSTEHLVVDADAAGDHGASVLSAFQSTAAQEKPEDTSGTEDRISPVKKVEEDGRDITLQATGSASQDSMVHDSQLDSASVGQPSSSRSDMKSVSPLAVAGLGEEPTGQSGSCEHRETHQPDGTQKEAKKKKGADRSGMCPEKAGSGIPGAPCRQDEGGPATRRSSRCAAAQQSYRGSSVLESRSALDVSKGEKKGEKEKKALLENPQILPPVRKKSRTFYSAEQLEELEKMFQEDHYPDNEKRREIAAVVGVTPQRILVWFQNRRAKWRKTEKLNVKGDGRYPTSSALLVPCGSDDYGAPPLPVPLLPDVSCDQSAVQGGNTSAGNYSSLPRACPAPLASASAPLVAGMVAACEAVQTEALPQLNFNSTGVECFLSLPSPPPIRRATNLSFNPHSPVVPLLLDTPNTECSLSTQENGSRETFPYSIQNQGLSPPVPCPYPEQLEPAGILESMYCQYSNQEGIYQLSQYFQQHQLSQFSHLPGHLATSELCSDHLPPPAHPESHPAFLAFPGNSGATQGYGQNHMGGQLMPQQPSGSSADISAYQTVPWSDFYMQEAPFSNQQHSQMPFSSTAEGQYFTDPYLLQVPNGTALGSVPQAGKQGGTPPEQSSSQSHLTEPELALLAETEDVESSSEGGDTTAETEEETE